MPETHADDWDLLNRVRRDPNALETLFIRHRDFVYRLAWSRLADVARAEDVTQEVFYRLATSRRRFFKGARFQTWLYRVVVNQVVDLQRSLTRLPPETTPTEVAGPDLRSDLEQVMEALSDFPERQREVVLLRLLEGFSTEETARALRISRGSVKTHLHRAKERLKVQFANVANPEDEESLPCSNQA